MRQPVRPKPQPKPKKPPKPDMPPHLLPSPYSRLFRLGKGEFPAVYEAVAAELKQQDVHAAAATLLKMVQDETYYEYDEDEDVSEDGDPRSWTRLHAFSTFQLLGEAARIGIQPLLHLLDDDDDYIQEVSAYYYAAMGEPAIEPLMKILLDSEADTYLRAGAGSALAEIGEQYAELRGRIVSLLEQALIIETNDELIAAFIITNLMDVGARESIPLIEQAFAEKRVDMSVVQMADVEEHFDLPRVTPLVDWRKEAGYLEDDDEDYDDWSEDAPLSTLTENEEPQEVQKPYVAEVKVGRNDPCPCGSGKKYKKCCGA